RPGGQLDRPGRELADAEFRALQIHQHADRPAELRLDGADDLVALPVLLVGAMAEVQPEHVGAGLKQGADTLGRRARGAQRGDDLGSAIALHAWSLNAMRPWPEPQNHVTATDRGRP